MSGPAPVTYANFVDQTNLGNTELPAYVSNSLNAHEDASCCSCFSSVALIFQSFLAACSTLFRMIGEALGIIKSTTEPDHAPPKSRNATAPVLPQTPLEKNISTLEKFTNHWCGNEAGNDWDFEKDGWAMIADFNKLDNEAKKIVRDYMLEYCPGMVRAQEEVLANVQGVEVDDNHTYQNAAIDRISLYGLPDTCKEMLKNHLQSLKLLRQVN
jgi:hypothetical protein